MKAKTARRFLRRNKWHRLGGDFKPSFFKRWKKCQQWLRLAKEV